MKQEDAILSILQFLRSGGAEPMRTTYGYDIYLPLVIEKALVAQHGQIDRDRRYQETQISARRNKVNKVVVGGQRLRVHRVRSPLFIAANAHVLSPSSSCSISSLKLVSALLR